MKRFFTNQGYELCGPVVVLADLVDLSVGIAPAGEDGSAVQCEEAPSSESCRKDAWSDAESPSPATSVAWSCVQGGGTCFGQKDAGSSTLNLSVGPYRLLQRSVFLRHET